MTATLDPSRWRRPANLAATTLTDALLPLHELFFAAAGRNDMIVRGRTFTNCRFEGPAVFLALGGVNFDGCDLGDAQGDIRNLLLSPVSPERVTGAMGFADCRFDACSFFMVGFTGPKTFLDQFKDIGAPPPSAAPRGRSS